jgi:hypothetical protein
VKASKLLDLLHLTWESPVFGNAYPLAAAVGGTPILQRIESMHSLLIARMTPILAAWMHPTNPSEIAEIIRQLAPKSTAFCSAIAAGEVEDSEHLVQAGLSIALIYWTDHRMDRGDLAMEEAVRWFASRWTEPASSPPALPDSPHIRTRLVGLQALVSCIRSFSRPEDADVLVRNVLEEVLCREVRVRELSRLYDPYNQAAFWRAYAEEAAEHSVQNVALAYVTAAIYAIHRRRQPSLPSLAHIFDQPAVMQLLNGPAAAMIRILDDFGDRAIDSGDDLRWGHFTLNIFNQPDPTWVRAFVELAGMHGQPAGQKVLEAFRTNDPQSHENIFRAFVDIVRDAFAAFPAPLYEAYQLFLELSKRVIEAGYVNALGDMALSELKA